MSIQRITLTEEDFKDADYSHIEDCPMARAAKRDLGWNELMVEPHNVHFKSPLILTPNMLLPVLSVHINGEDYKSEERDNRSCFDRLAFEKCKELIEQGQFESCVIEVEQS